MERYEFDEALKEEIRARTLGEGFMKLVQTVRRGGSVFRISLRPVEIGGERKYQAEMADGADVRVKNLDANGAAEGLEEIIAQKGARDLHLMTARGDLHVRVTKKGHVLASRSAEMDRVVTVRAHDRVKNVPLAAFDSGGLLAAVGITDGAGKVRASMRGKYDQVNEFLKVVGEAVPRCPAAARHEPFVAADVFAGLLRQGILRERMCDLLTDTFRALILRILGFRVQVVEFVSSEATARNILLRCERGVKAGQPGPVGEYLALRDFWGVTPWLEERLGALLAGHLSRFA
ncbi:MAG: hypothetical protein IJ829_04785 [Kiritimatiellae bacterium]|nr:hypothetical protein [Kiritimatiellia bacterium]